MTEKAEIGSSPDGGGCFEGQGPLHRPITAAHADTKSTGRTGGDARSHGPIIVTGSIVQLAYHESEQSASETTRPLPERGAPRSSREVVSMETSRCTDEDSHEPSNRHSTPGSVPVARADEGPGRAQFASMVGSSIAARNSADGSHIASTLPTTPIRTTSATSMIRAWRTRCSRLAGTRRGRRLPTADVHGFHRAFPATARDSCRTLASKPWADRGGPQPGASMNQANALAHYPVYSTVKQVFAQGIISTPIKDAVCRD
jgi:hypothetical protein